LTENEIKLLVQQEIRNCFATLTKDLAQLNAKMEIMSKENRNLQKGVDRIERVLLGDEELKDVGYAEKIQFSYAQSKICAQRNEILDDRTE
jgi:hypothetical protein